MELVGRVTRRLSFNRRDKANPEPAAGLSSGATSSQQLFGGSSALSASCSTSASSCSKDAYQPQLRRESGPSPPVADGLNFSELLARQRREALALLNEELPRKESPHLPSPRLLKKKVSFERKRTKSSEPVMAPVGQVQMSGWLFKKSGLLYNKRFFVLAGGTLYYQGAQP